MKLHATSSIRRLAAIVLALGGLAAFALAAQAASATAAGFATQPLVPQIINGQEAQISQYPWQVYVLAVEGGGSFGSCGGSILNETTIITAAHCVDHEESTETYPAEDLWVIAGASEVLLAEDEAHPASRQEIRAKSIRVDPDYVPLKKGGPDPRDDVAIITLEKPLVLSAERATQTISLVPEGSPPAPGTTLSVSGYGKEEGAESAQPNGKFYATTLTMMSDSECLSSVGTSSAVLMCAKSSTSATCQGDSGGPLTEGSPAVEVGLVDLGPTGCPAGQPDVFTNLAVPEIRAFVEGSTSPPVAPSPATSPPALKTAGAVGSTPVDFSPVTCENGGWSGSPTSYTYVFQASNSTQVLQSGASNVYTPPSSAVGTPLECIVQASNAGGTAINISAATPAIAADATPPVASITGLKCKAQSCTLSFSASDPNDVALSASATASYSATAKCPAKKGKKKKKGKQPLCHKTLTVNMPVKAAGANAYSAAVGGLPYGRQIKLSALVTNAAGLHPTTPPSTLTTLHKPKRKPGKSKKKKKSKKH